ncbi:MAG: hypothetical protein U0794_13080 [Isosphaeraceae bacterium]
MVIAARLILGHAVLALVSLSDERLERPAPSNLTQGRVVRLVTGDQIPVRPAGQIRLQGRWHGQDQHDLVGEPNSIAPNGVQDIHLTLGGLPPRLEIVRGWIYGHGSGEWQLNGLKNNYAVALVRKPRAMTADVYFEPDRVETGREWHVKLEFNDGTIGEVYIPGGKANPNLRMADASMSASWIGQDRVDLVGTGPSVGPDGLQDARIALSRLAKKDRVVSVTVKDQGGSAWSAGPNPTGAHNAEFIANPSNAAEGTLHLQPDRDLNGRKLEVVVTYASGKTDTARLTGGRTDPKLSVARGSLPRLVPLTLQSRWLGQDGSVEAGPGSVHVSVTGVPPARTPVAAVLSDGVRGTWVYRVSDRVPLDIEPDARPLVVRRGSTRNSLDLHFAPTRDETKTTLTLRLVFQDGETAVGTFPGGSCDVSRVAPQAGTAQVVARPGDDLNSLAARGGTITLSPGEYRLSQPLVLPRAVTLVGEPNAILMFNQATTDAPWSTAVKIHSGGTTLRGFSIRFAGPIRWRPEVSWGPAVIGTTDNFDNVPPAPKPGLVFEKLDIEGPPSANPKTWEEAPRLMRLKDSAFGRVVGCTLRGGVIETFDGPWVFEGNRYRGTSPGTHVASVFAVHDPHDTIVRNNEVKPESNSGKTWRFLVFTNHGYADRVEGNKIEGVGPRDDDTIPSMNSPEIILTESYKLWFEGRPTAVSTDGRLVRIPATPLAGAEAPRTGDVVSVVSGTGAGQWRRISQRIEPNLFLLEEPLPRGADAITITPGLIHGIYDKNRIDARWGREAAGVVLAGNHFGTLVSNNHVIGAGEGFRIMAAPTEVPVTWGWSHAPYLGGRFEGNIVEDAQTGASFAVQHGGPIKSNKGRVYMTVNLKGNTVVWSDEFLKRIESNRVRNPLAGILLGSVPSLDPNELVIITVDDHLRAPVRAPRSSAMRVEAAVVNGRPFVKQNFSLPEPVTASAGAGATGLGGPGLRGSSRR